MFQTPPRKMATRRLLRKEREQREQEERDGQSLNLQPETEPNGQKSDELSTINPTIVTNTKAGSVVKSEPPLKMVSQMETHPRSVKTNCKKSISSSVAARKAKLELEAAEAKAKIQMELIDKKLAAELADIDDQCSVRSQRSSHTHSDVQKWLERSHQHLELGTQPAPDHGHNSGAQCPPPTSNNVGNENGTVQLLASALKDLTTASANNGMNSTLLSRISTSRDLPTFSGDPMEFLQFKQAYEESSQVCNFTSKENLWRLRKCLRGPAREAVSALLISASTPEMVMSTLELQFGNPDLILSRIMLDIKKLHPVSQEYHKDIVSFSVKIRNYVAAVSVIGRDEYLVATNVITSVLSKLPTVLLSKWADYSYPLIKQGKRPTLHTLAEFLNEEALKINSMALINTRSTLEYNYSYKKKCPESTSNRLHTTLLNNEKSIDNNCSYCHTSKHKVTECKKFIKSLRKDRWAYVKRHRLCYKCLLSKHGRDTCPAAACDIDNCGLAHHRLLHYKLSKPTAPRSDDTNLCERSEGRGSSERLVSECQAELQPESINMNSTSECKVCLKVVRVNLHGPNGIISAYALLDDGSTLSFISAALTSRLGLRGRRDTIRTLGAWNNELVCETEVVCLEMSTCDGNTYELNARSVKELNLPNQYLCSVNCNYYSHLKDISLNLCTGNIKPEMLIGQDNYHLLLPLETRIGKLNEPCATLTPLGWCVHGRIPVTSSRMCHPHATLFIKGGAQSPRDDEGFELQQLHDEVRKSFTIDSLGITSKPRQNADDLRAVEHLEKTATLINNRWHVGLPWRDPSCVMPDSKPTALRRLKGLEKKMTLNEDYAQRYMDRVNHLFKNDFAKEVTENQLGSKIWYLPHFGVDNPNKKKLRLIFDAAAKSQNLSLNDYLFKGPDLLASLFGIMLRFREYKIAIAGDIKDMFLRIKILPEDQDSLRFLWRDNVKSPIKTYKMTSLIFGANCSPFIAQFIKNKNAQRFSSTMPSAVEAISKQHYMDDYIDSQPADSFCIKLANDVDTIHKEGGFVVCNWLSNSTEVLNNLPSETLASNAYKLKIGQQLDGERTLGLIWYPGDDTLGFDVTFKRIPPEIMDGKRPTKREALRLIMSIFDVYGFLSPFTINGKIILQQTWKSNIDWDETLDDVIYEKWLKWLKLLKSVSDIRLPRCYQRVSNIDTYSPTLAASDSVHNSDNSDGYGDLQLHIMSDASTQAMCAVAFWRWIENNEIRVAFVSSKCRVAPVKPMTVPRLELQAALMAARLADTVQKEHRIKAKRRVFWCDSTTVLQWLRNNKRDYPIFVAHRLGEIDELTNINEWRFCPTDLNVADIGTRESYDNSVFQNEWFTGPKFLYCCENMWPADIMSHTNTALVNCEAECVSTVREVSESLPVPDPGRFSSWLRLMRSTVVMLKFIDKCRRKVLTSDCSLMYRAENLLLKVSQIQSFSNDIDDLKAKRSLPKNSRLLTLSPFFDEHGVLRVRGRIDAAADVPLEVKQPVILDGKNYITRLIVRYHHIKAGHGNQEMVVNELKQKYCILRIRPTVKHVASKCMLCRIMKAKPEVPKMGDLPAGRVAHHQRAFTHCGLDLFGPMEVTVARHRQKRYGVLFTCLTVRAVHIEVVQSLTTDSLLMALRRMASRRGWPGYLYSDNGTNLRGADAEIKKSIQELDEEMLKTTASNYGTHWVFSPPKSPNWGGAWERLIKSVKITLKVILKERAPRDETLNTLLAEVENMVNSRPLNHVSVEVGSRESLTPNHFLLGSSSNLPVLGVFDDSDLYLRKQWRISQALADMFWRRWVREILPDMIPRQKWNIEQRRPLAVGDLVFIADPDTPRGVWPRGIVQQTFPGKDGRVRVVAVRTSTGTFKRSVGRVARIPTESECCQGSTRGESVSDT